MPRPGPRRPLVNARLDPEYLTELQTRAAEETAGNVSELIRRMLYYARRMPKGWKP
jgi:hypothetical protein